MNVTLEKLGDASNLKVRLVAEDEAGVKRVLAKAPRRLSGKVSPARAEYVMGQWAAVDNSAPSYSENEPNESVSDALAGASTPEETVTVDFSSSTPDVITLPESENPIVLKLKPSADQEVLVESNGPVNGTVSLSVDSASSLKVNLPKASVEVPAGTIETLSVEAVGNITIGTDAQIDTLVVKSGAVLVNNAYVEDNVKNFDGAKNISSNVSFNASASTPATDLVAVPRVVKFTDDVSTEVVFKKTGAHGHFVYDMQGHTFDAAVPGDPNILINSSCKGVKVTVDGNGKFTCSDETQPNIWNCSPDCSVEVLSGDFESAHCESIYAQNGLIEIYGGTFKTLAEDKRYVLNCKDDKFAAGTAKIVVYGGKFYDYNPAAAPSETGNPSFLAEGYTVKSYQEGEHTVYEVVPAE